MYIIAGLGNPEKKYDNTRHNAGFSVIDRLAANENISISKIQLKAAIGAGNIAGEKVILVKPLTYMNLSGEAIRPLCDYYKVDPKTNLIVVSDDTDLDIGVIRIRKKGSSGGHNGLKNIIMHLGDNEFIRLKVGAGNKGEGGDQIRHVLSQPRPEDRKEFELAIERAADAVLSIIKDGCDKAMNIYNTKKKETETEDK